MTMRQRVALFVLGLFAATGQIAPTRGWRLIATARDPAIVRYNGKRHAF